MHSSCAASVARRGGRCPVWAPTVAVGPACRLRCASRSALASRNSLHSLRSFRSDNRGETVVEARAAHVPSALLRCSPPHKSPPPGAAHRAELLMLFDDACHSGAGKAEGGCASAATYAAPSIAELMAACARRTLRLLTRRDCSSEANAVSVASFSAGHEIEQRRGEPGRARVPADSCSPGEPARHAGRAVVPSAQRRAAAFERRRMPARGFASADRPK
jgi:hypothetical protein